MSRSAYLRPLAALTLLVAEYLAITFGFDAAPLESRTGAWEALSWVGLLAPAVMAFGAALWIFAGDALREAFGQSNDASGVTASVVVRLIVHLACFATFYAITAFAFGTATPPDGSAELWIFLWLASGAAAVVSLLPVAGADAKLLPFIRELSVPIILAALLAIIAWGAGLATLELWAENSRLTLNAVAAVLDTLRSDIYFEPADMAIGTDEFWVQIAPICSGYEGIGLIVVFLSAYLVGFRDRFRFPHALLLLPAAIVAVWLLNVVRIVALILIGHAGYPDVALGGFHSKAGWVFFCAVALGAVWMSQQIPWFTRIPRATRGNVVNPSAPFLLPLLAVLGTSLVSGLFIEDFDYLYPLRVLAGLLILLWYRKDYLAGLRQHLHGRSIVSPDAVFIGVSVYLIWIGISAVTGDYESGAAPMALDELGAPMAVVWIIGRALGSVIVAPIVEELAFRGFLLRRVIASDFTKAAYNQWHWPAVLVSSVAFAAVHQQWVGGLLAGLLYAYAQKRRGLLSDAILAHAITNALIAAQVLVGGYWSLW